MAIDFSTLLDIGLLLIAGLGGWVVTSLRESNADLKSAISSLHIDLEGARQRNHAFQLSVAERYATRELVDKNLERVFSILERIEAKLDGKVDK